jgi:RepB DNA-primase from phage plasmid
MIDDKAARTTSVEHNAGQALAMLDAFASVGARVFDLSIIDMNGNQVEGMQRTGESLEQLRRRIGGDLQVAESNRHNVIIRPRSTTALLVQLDDFSPEKAAQLEPYAFITICTSPGNGQVWLAVADGPKESEKEAAKAFRKRVRRGAGADKSATGATRISGSLNFKQHYAPEFPTVTLAHINHGKTITAAQLEQAGLIAPAEEPVPILPPASVPRRMPPLGATPARYWPDYEKALRGAPLKKHGNGPDRSLADYMFCRWAAQRGWTVEEIAIKLMEVSPKAQEQARRGDEGYAKVTAWNAVQSVGRDRSYRQSLKSATNRR